MLFVTLAILASENVKALNHQMETKLSLQRFQ